MKKIIKQGTKVIFSESGPVFTIHQIYRYREESDRVLINGMYDDSDEFVQNIPFDKIYAIITPLSLKDKAVQQAKIISVINREYNYNNN